MPTGERTAGYAPATSAATCPKTGCPSSGPKKIATGLIGAYGIAVDDTATVEGTLQTPVISVASGAAIQGECAIDGRRPAA